MCYLIFSICFRTIKQPNLNHNSTRSGHTPMPPTTLTYHINLNTSVCRELSSPPPTMSRYRSPSLPPFSPEPWVSPPGIHPWGKGKRKHRHENHSRCSLSIDQNKETTSEPNTQEVEQHHRLIYSQSKPQVKPNLLLQPPLMGNGGKRATQVTKQQRQRRGV